MVVFPGKWYDEVRVGDTFGSSLTVTETHLVLGAGMLGPFTSALVSSSAGMYFAGTAIAYLEHACRFKAPVHAGDTLTTVWTIVEKSDKPKHRGGMVTMRGETRNQRNEIAVEADGKMLVASRPAQ